MLPSLISKNIIRFTLNSGKSEIEDLLAVEKEIVIHLKDKIFSLSGTPNHIKELVLGFLITQNLIEKSTFPESIEIEESSEKILVKVRTLKKLEILNPLTQEEKDLKIEASKLLELFKTFVEASKLFEITGGTHSACLAEEKKILFFVEDIRRHNTMDKVIGWAYLNKISLKDKMLFISSRISSEIVKKAMQAKIPLIASRGAPTSLAVNLAEKNEITLIGFLREKRFNLYTHPQRVIF